MRPAERFDIRKEGMISHTDLDIRVATRMQGQSAGTVPVLRDAARWGTSGLMEEQVEIDLARLRQLITENAGKGKRFTRRGLSLAATDGKNPDLVRDIFRVDKRKPTIQSVSGICRALGVPLSAVVKGVDYTGETINEWLVVTGTVAAGVWREQVEWPRDEWYEIEVNLSDQPGHHVGLVVEGRSMDKTLPEGTILRCVDLIGSNIDIQPDDYVIVEQRRNGLTETTCKRLSRRADGDWELLAESTLPQFQQPIHIGKPVETHDAAVFDAMDEHEIRVKALVIDAYLPLRRRNKRAIQ